MSGLFQDVRYPLRQSRRSRSFAAVAVITLALGIGATTAIVSIVNTSIVNIVLRPPLPHRHRQQLVLVAESLRAVSSDGIAVSASEYLDYRDRNRSFWEITSYESTGFNLTGQGPSHRVNAPQISSPTVSFLGDPKLGHVFTKEDDRYGSSHAVILSHALWESEYSGDRNIVGKTVKLGEQPCTIIGVMPPSFRFPFDGAALSEMADLWVLDSFSPHQLAPENCTEEFGVGLIARLKPGISIEKAQQDFVGIAKG